MSSEFVGYVVLCANCGKFMGNVDADELEYVNEDKDSNLCFDCDPESAATTPSIFWQWQEGDLFQIGGNRFEVCGEYLVRSRTPLVRAHERTHERDLSSYTNLNRNTKKGVLLGNGYEVTMCPDCQGTGQLFDYDGTSDCSRCGGAGMEYSAVYIPVWILGLGCENV